MSEEIISVGLDIGTTKIVAIVGRKDKNGEVEILGKGQAKSEGLRRGVVNNVKKTTEAIQKAIAEAQDQSGYKIKKVIVGIAGQHIDSMQHSAFLTKKQFFEIDEKDVERLKQQVLYNEKEDIQLEEEQEILHALVQEYKIENETGIIDPVGMQTKRLEADFHIVLAKTSALENIKTCVKRAGLSLVGDMILEPVASASAVLSKEEKEAGVVLVDIGGGTTDIAIFKNEVICHTAVIPFGGNIVTEDIAEGCEVLVKQAERLKVEKGSAWPKELEDHEYTRIEILKGREPKTVHLKTLSEVIYARMQEVFKVVQKEVAKYEENRPKKNKLIAGIVLTGGGAQLQHLDQLVVYVTGMETRKGTPNQYLQDDVSQEYASPIYATAVGLLIQGLKKQMNCCEKIEKKVVNVEPNRSQNIQKNLENTKLKTTKKR